MGQATGREQYALELINRFRMDPGGEFDRLIADPISGEGFDPGVTAALAWFFVDLDSLRAQLGRLSAVAPLAWNDALADAATAHNGAMRAADQQSHQVAGELSLGARADAAGYQWSVLAENVYAYAENPDHAHAGFVIDWGYDAGESGADRSGGDGIQDPAGHRLALMSSAYTEIGIDWMADADAGTSVGPWLTSQELAAPTDDAPRLTGVSYRDSDEDRFYSMGEGRGGMTVTVQGHGAAETAAAGGYALEVARGQVRATLSGGGLSRDVRIALEVGSENVKLDMVDDRIVETNVDATGLAGLAGLRALGSEGLTLRGGGGQQKIWGGDGDDMLFGGRGRDQLSAGAGHDVLYGGSFNDVLDGGSEGDRLYGGRGWDRLLGGQGDDRLYGDEGGDELRGAKGRDVLRGGDGDDRLWGGPGRDVFVFDASDGTDRIEDWAAVDRIDLRPSGLGLSDVTIGTRGDDAYLLFGATSVLIIDAADDFSSAALLV